MAIIECKRCKRVLFSTNLQVHRVPIDPCGCIEAELATSNKLIEKLKAEIDYDRTDKKAYEALHKDVGEAVEDMKLLSELAIKLNTNIKIPETIDRLVALLEAATKESK